MDGQWIDSYQIYLYAHRYLISTSRIVTLYQSSGASTFSCSPNQSKYLRWFFSSSQKPLETWEYVQFKDLATPSLTNKEGNEENEALE